MLTLYIAGPMTGLPEHNWPEFRRWTDLLRGVGYSVVSPVELVSRWYDGSREFTRDDYHRAMRDGIRAIVGNGISPHVDGIACLDGWANSRGAVAEVNVGIMAGIPSAHVEAFFARGRGAS